MSLVSGTRLGRYEIRAKLGEGGMGEVYRAYDDTMHREVAIKVLPTALTSERKPYLYFQSPTEDTSARFSPDARFIAYRSRESGVNQVYVQTFPPSGGKWSISTNGGQNPFWSSNGKEVFFIASDDKLMAVEIGAGNTFKPGVTKPVFDLAAARTIHSSDYGVSTDGHRFLFISRMADVTSSLTVVVNWTADLKK